MKVLILGIGLQGRAALYHLANSPDVEEIIATDSDLERAEACAKKFGGGKTSCVKLDAEDHDAVLKLMSSGVDVVIELLPSYFAEVMSELAIEAGVHLVNASYASRKLDAEAAQKGITILPEFGMDLGIDLVMCAKAIGELDEVQELYSYGAGFPEPEAANNPLKYKITWTFEGVLRSYKRHARILKDGEPIDIPATEISRFAYFRGGFQDLVPQRQFIVNFLPRFAIEVPVNDSESQTLPRQLERPFYM